MADYIILLPGIKQIHHSILPKFILHSISLQLLKYDTSANRNSTKTINIYTILTSFSILNSGRKFYLVHVGKLICQVSVHLRTTHYTKFKNYHYTKMGKNCLIFSQIFPNSMFINPIPIFVGYWYNLTK